MRNLAHVGFCFSRELERVEGACTCPVSAVLKKSPHKTRRRPTSGIWCKLFSMVQSYQITSALCVASSCTLPCWHWTCRLASHRGKTSYGSVVQIMNSYGSRCRIMQRFFCIVHFYHTVLSARSYHFTASFVLSLMATGKFPDCSLFFFLFFWEMIHNIWLWYPVIHFCYTPKQQMHWHSGWVLKVCPWGGQICDAVKERKKERKRNSFFWFCFSGISIVLKIHW